MTSEHAITHPVYWTDVPNSGVHRKISATKNECVELAKILGVVSLARVEARFEITRWSKSGLKAVADINADVVQNCVVSLEKISSTLHEQTEWFFKPEVRPNKNADIETAVLIDPLGDDPADPLIDGKVDVGHLLVEHLCLMIDPYIRSKNIEFDTVYNEVHKSSKFETADVSPFSVLKHIGEKT